MLYLNKNGRIAALAKLLEWEWYVSLIPSTYLQELKIDSNLNSVPVINDYSPKKFDFPHGIGWEKPYAVRVGQVEYDFEEDVEVRGLIYSIKMEDEYIRYGFEEFPEFQELKAGLNYLIIHFKFGDLCTHTGGILEMAAVGKVVPG